MIPIERIKQLLDDPKISDEEAEKIRDGFRFLVEDIIFESWLANREKNKSKNN